MPADPSNPFTLDWAPARSGKLDLEKLQQPKKHEAPERIHLLQDVFDGRLTHEDIAAIFGVMAATPRHTYFVCTRHPHLMRRWFDEIKDNPHKVGNPEVRTCVQSAACVMVRNFSESDAAGIPWPLQNVWIGVIAENQRQANERVPDLMLTPARRRFVRCEPLRDAIDLSHLENVLSKDVWTALGGQDSLAGAVLDWVIIGGDCGLIPHPTDIGHMRGIVAQCRTAKIPVFITALGVNPVRPRSVILGNGVGVVDRIPVLGQRTGKPPVDPRGANILEWPSDLRIRQLPK